MNGRVLVWPWHGLLQGGQIRLADDSYRPHPQPPNDLATLALGGACDTHRIVVEGVAPITEAEDALLPPGGEWWAGEALLSGTWLYGVDLQGWIAQTSADSRWWVKVEGVSVGASTTTGQFRVRRFGRIGGPADEQTISFTLPAGRLPSVEASRVGADLGGSNVGFLRLHAVSETGCTAVLALVSRNVGSSYDRRPRAYRFFTVSVSETEGVIDISTALLYGIDDISITTTTLPPSPKLRVIPPQRTEIDRVPVYTPTGDLWGHDVTYSLDSPSGLEEWHTSEVDTTPGTHSRTRKLLVQVNFSGETPVPVYFEVGISFTVPWPDLEWSTLTPQVRRESLSGDEITVEQHYEVRLTGGSSYQYSIDVSLGSWSHVIDVSVSSVVDGARTDYTGLPNDALTLTQEVIGPRGFITRTWQTSISNIGQALGLGLGFNPLTRQPYFECSAGVSVDRATYELSFDLFSNNLIGASARIREGNVDLAGPEYQAVIARGAALPHSGAYQGLSAYGSYNPATGEFLVASTPVNWI